MLLVIGDTWLTDFSVRPSNEVVLIDCLCMEPAKGIHIELGGGINNRAVVKFIVPEFAFLPLNILGDIELPICAHISKWSTEVDSLAPKLLDDDIVSSEVAPFWRETVALESV